MWGRKRESARGEERRNVVRSTVSGERGVVTEVGHVAAARYIKSRPQYRTATRIDTRRAQGEAWCVRGESAGSPSCDARARRVGICAITRAHGSLAPRRAANTVHCGACALCGRREAERSRAGRRKIALQRLRGGAKREGGLAAVHGRTSDCRGSAKRTARATSARGGEGAVKRGRPAGGEAVRGMVNVTSQSSRGAGGGGGGGGWGRTQEAGATLATRTYT